MTQQTSSNKAGPKRFKVSITPAKAEPINQPFPGNGTKPTDEDANKHSVSVLGMPQVLNPFNQTLGEKYVEENSDTLISHVTKVRDFFLTDLAPQIIGLSTGLADAKEVLSVAFGEEPDVAGVFHKITEIHRQAMVMKIVDFIAVSSKMTTEQKNRLLELNFQPTQAKMGMQDILHAVEGAVRSGSQQKVASVETRPQQRKKRDL